MCRALLHELNFSATLPCLRRGVAEGFVDRLGGQVDTQVCTFEADVCIVRTSFVEQGTILVVL
eukprot:29790-Eustigmatos_ZCMA.PRE.1